MELRPEEITKIIRSQIKNYEAKLEVSETGIVILVGITCKDVGLIVLHTVLLRLHWRHGIDRHASVTTNTLLTVLDLQQSTA